MHLKVRNLVFGVEYIGIYKDVVFKAEKGISGGLKMFPKVDIMIRLQAKYYPKHLYYTPLFQTLLNFSEES